MDDPPRFLVVGLGATGAVIARRVTECGGCVAGFVRRPDDDEVRTRNLDDPSEREAARLDSAVKRVRSADEVRAFRADVVVVTLDHSALVSEAGERTLRLLVDAVPGEAVFCALQPGLDTVQRYMDAGLVRERIFWGAFDFLSRAVPTEAKAATYEFHFLDGPNVLFIGEGSGKGAVRVRDALSQLPWGELRISRLPISVWAATSHLVFPYLAACALDGWRAGGPTPARVQLAAGAMSEMSTLSSAGVVGTVVSWLVWPSPVVRAAMWAHRRQFAPQMDFDEFGRAHHGLKVARQDLDVLVQYRDALRTENKSTYWLDVLIADANQAGWGVDE